MKASESQQRKDSNPAAQKLFEQTYDWTNQCIQCGYCLPACPTYASMGKESASPRGRINLVKMASEGKIEIQEHLAKPIDLCLGCRACETACPVGVPYGYILEAARETVENSRMKEQKTAATRLKNGALTHLFSYPGRMKTVGNLLWFYQKSGLNQLVRRTKVLNKLAEPLAQLEKAIPLIESPSKRIRHGTTVPPKGEKKIRVAFFTGCIMDAMMARINRLTIELLASIGCEVVIPKAQTCCGALHVHQGANGMAKELAKANIRAFENSGADFYVNNAGGCGAALVEYDHILANEGEWSDLAKEFVKKSKDISQILVQYGPLPFKKSLADVVVYQDSCHLRNVQKVTKEPRLLLQSIPGANYLEMEGADRCCASGGIYNLLNFDESMKILDEKMAKIAQTNPTVVVAANPGCQLQMSLGIQRHGRSNKIRSMHLVELLAESCGLE